ncbi:unnamed protein product [Pleuronectes platessa]|uniref:Nucleoporin SEH1 n=1 Tax=Pleuronectes platessa TaxID=8262 RepID=A0A9N7UNN4_PLEPL|nr:unnamed protein product [Pleuronectes platessa]
MRVDIPKDNPNMTCQAVPLQAQSMVSNHPDHDPPSRPDATPVLSHRPPPPTRTHHKPPPRSWSTARAQCQRDTGSATSTTISPESATMDPPPRPPCSCSAERQTAAATSSLTRSIRQTAHVHIHQCLQWGVTTATCHTKYAKAETLMTVTDAVHDIAFAPNLGRSFHVLAIATKDVRIFKLVPMRKDSTSTGPTKFEVQIMAQFDNHNSQVWRVSWNITSTLLASSGDDGCVRLWKANYMDNWKCTGILKGDGSPLTSSSGQPTAMSTIVGSSVQSPQNALNGMSAGRYFFPPLDFPRAGTRYGHLLPPSSLIEHCDAEPIQPQQQALPNRHSSRSLLTLPEAEGQ